jgi:hypothetical protein
VYFSIVHLDPRRKEPLFTIWQRLPDARIVYEDAEYFGWPVAIMPKGEAAIVRLDEHSGAGLVIVDEQKTKM